MIPDNLLPKSIRRAENAISTHFIEVPRGITLDHVMDPDLWVHIARKFAVNDTITVLAADGSFDCDLRVVEIDPRFFWVRVRMLRLYQDVEASQKMPRTVDEAGYRIEFGGAHKWRIIDRVGDIVEKGIPTRAEAEARLVDIKMAKVTMPIAA